jgi:hypothetical protein
MVPMGTGPGPPLVGDSTSENRISGARALRKRGENNPELVLISNT